MIQSDKTITTIFIVPTIGISLEDLRANGFINGYLDDYNHVLDYENVVYFVFKPKDLEKFQKFLDNLYEVNNLIIEDYDLNDTIIVVFKFKEDFKADYDIILSSKYSKTSKEFQDNFLQTVTVNGKKEKSLQKMIFDKDIRLAKYWSDILGTEVIIQDNLELWPEMKLEREILNYKE